MVKVYFTCDEWWPFLTESTGRYSEFSVELDKTEWETYQKALNFVEQFQKKLHVLYDSK